MARRLLRSANAALLAAIEIHNKPIFPYRYEISVLLAINAWELLLKAYLWKFRKRVKLFRKDGTTKDFPECVGCVGSCLGLRFEATKENLKLLYDYRNKAAHFFWETLDPILFSLLKANVMFYADFAEQHFGINLSPNQGFMLLPIGLGKPFSPVDFLSDTSSLQTASNEVRDFIKAIVDSSQRLLDAGIQESVLVEYKMNLTNENRVKNADVIAGINNSIPNTATLAVRNVLNEYRPSQNPDAREVRIVEESMFEDYYTQEFADILEKARGRFVDFKQNDKFNRLMAGLKGNPEFHKVRLLNPKKPKSGRKDWYSERTLQELAKHYSEKPQRTLPLEQTA